MLPRAIPRRVIREFPADREGATDDQCDKRHPRIPNRYSQGDHGEASGLREAQNAARHERPHWLNPESVMDEPVFDLGPRYANKLYKPVIVESAAQENTQWLLDVMLDSRAEIQPVIEQENPPRIGLAIASNQQYLWSLWRSRLMVETVLKQVMQDDSASLSLGYRNSPDRLFIRLDAQIARSWQSDWRGYAFTVTPYLKVLNALNRRDALFYHFDRGSATPEPRAIAAVPLLPVFGVEWRF
jgi:hypothetical protein